MYKVRNNEKGETLGGRSYFGVHFYPKESASKWWDKHRNKTTKEITNMIKTWYIKREMDFGFEDEEQKSSILGGIERRFSEG